MLSTSTTLSKPARARGALAGALALLTVLVLVVAGCGGGGGGGGSTGAKKSGKKGGTTTSGKSGAKPGAAAASIPFSAKVSSPTKAQLSVSLSQPGAVIVQVRKLGAAKPAKVGKVTFGSKPKGRSTIPWDLKVAGKKLGPGKYKLVARAGKGAGKSKPVTITVPGG